MKDAAKTKAQLLETLRVERERAASLERAESRYRSLSEGIADGIIIHDPEGHILDANRVTCDRLGYAIDELRAMHLRDILPPNRQDQIGVHWQPVLDGQLVRFETEYLARDGGRIICEVIEQAIDFEGRRAVQSLSRDITERKRSEAALAQRSAQMEALREMGMELNLELELGSLLQSIAARAIDLLGGTSGGLYLRRPEENILERVVSLGADGMRVGSTLKPGQGLCGRVWEKAEPLIVDHYQQWDGRVAEFDSDLPVSVVGVPIQSGEDVLGVLNVNMASEREGAFSSADAELLSMFATHAAIAIRNARLYDQAQRELTERREAEAELRRREEAERLFQERLRSLLEVTHALEQTESLAELCRRAVELGRLRLGFDRLGIWLVDEADPDYILGTFGTDKTGATRDERAWRRRFSQVTDLMEQTEGVQVVHRHEPLLDAGEEVLPEGDRAMAALADGERIIGLISTDNLLRRQPITPRDEELLVLYASALTNIFSRRHAEQALRESEQRYRSLFEDSFEAISLTQDGKFVDVNPAWLAMHGFRTKDEVVGMDVIRIIDPKERDVLRERRKAPVKGKRRTYQLKDVRRDGSVLDVEIHSSTILLDGKETVLTTLRDITKQKQADEERKRLEDRLRQVQKQRIEELRKLAMLDSLTEIGNRRYGEIQLQSRLDEMRRYGASFGVLIADIDHFKNVNDSYGHDVGDEVLKRIAQALSASVRSSDVVTRWGGEEFLAIIINAGIAELGAVAEKLRTVIEDTECTAGGDPIPITISIGATLAQPSDAVDTLIKRADRLLYHSKSAGRNRVSVR